jgi:hypothetical protein
VNPGRVLVGLILVSLGVVYLLDQSDVLDAGDTISRWWPAVIVALGVLQYVSDRRTLIGSAVLVAVGLILLGIRLDLVGNWIWGVFWPLAVIVLGIWILAGRTARGGDQATGDGVAAFTALSGRTVRSASATFSGGHVTAILGGLEVDLRDATPAPGAVLSATAILGGVDVIVPEGWDVTVSGTPILGGWDDTTRRDVVGPGSPRLEVRALTILGGLEVRHPKRWQ